jgi:hypothetical protein
MLKKIIKSFGGAQRKMRDTMIKQEHGYLEPYLCLLNPGDTQSMVFKDTDNGPFWMSRAEQEKTSHNKIIQDKTKTQTLRRAEENGICSKVTSAKVVEGWEGKAKGLLQVLWERGFINATNLENYTMNGRQDACGILIPDTSLKLLMANCLDFEEEESLLQANRHEM